MRTQANCPTIHGWLKKLWSIDTMERDSSLRKKRCDAAICDHEDGTGDNTRSEMRQTERVQNHLIWLRGGIETESDKWAGQTASPRHGPETSGP